ncbi:hypothetical protein [Solihabitans fulvus]|uniref:hypothetical protein n=1 Tax=Solihabitans fulvus TaxID=1892852 RepID=UPI0016620EFC|nr:hypothetical protein [Solihabitans fulvus]
MDPRDRADALLARARARSRYVVAVDNATSPMDASSTQQIPRTMVTAADPRMVDPDSTMVLSARTAQGMSGQLPQQTTQPPAPAQGQQQQPAQQPHQQGQQPAQQQPGQQAQQPQQAGQAPQPPQAPQPVQPPEPTQAPGLVPTFHQQQGNRQSMSQRLSGE